MNARLRLASAAGLAAIILLAVPGLALAHERREIGPYTVIVGWVNEPAYVNEPNKVDFRVTNTQTNQPVEGVEKTVKVDVTYGGKTQTFDLLPRFGQPGAYTADILPTRNGDYIFAFKGSIDGTPIDQKFDSAEGKFNGIQSFDKVAFPEPPVSVSQVQDRVARSDAAIADAQAAARTATLIGAAGAVLGLAGLLVAGIAIASSRRRAAAGLEAAPGRV